MSRRSRAVVESLRGNGQILSEGTWIADARYEITVLQEYLHPRTFGGAQEPIPGQKIINGALLVTKGEKDLVQGNVLTLVLEDGRKWDFFCKRGDPIKGSCIAVNSGSSGIYGPDEPA